MKFRIKVSNKNSEWWEDYDKDITDPHEWGKEIIKSFNSRLRIGELPREFLEAEVLDEESIKDHDWSKINLVTIIRGKSVYDEMKCQRCGITGKRHGLSPSVQIDSKYRANVYSRCDTAKAHLDKKNHLINH